jgi:hypothetical protein
VRTNAHEGGIPKNGANLSTKRAECNFSVVKNKKSGLFGTILKNLAYFCSHISAND